MPQSLTTLCLTQVRRIQPSPFLGNKGNGLPSMKVRSWKHFRTHLVQLIANTDFPDCSDTLWNISLLALSGVIIMAPQYESEEVGKSSEQNGVKVLQMVHFECPRH